VLSYTSRDFKRKQRAARIASLPSVYHTAITAFDRSVVAKPIEELVQEVHRGVLQPIDVLHTYGKIAVRAQEKTNCLTELLLPEAEEWAKTEVDLKGPLAGVPVSLKDSVQVKGFDTTLGYSQFAGNSFREDGVMVKLLKDAGMEVMHLSFLFSFYFIKGDF
jgi:fatty acid amide hydrolase